MYKKIVLLLSICFFSSHLNVFGYLNEDNDLKQNEINLLFPEKFTKDELDLLKDQQKIVKNNLVFFLTDDDARKLYKNYPQKWQVVTGPSFSDRVKKTSDTIIENPKSAKTRYIVESSYLGSLNDNKGFFVHVEKIVDTYLSLLNVKPNDKMVPSTSILKINDIDELFIRQTPTNSFDRITSILTSWMLVLEEIKGNIVSNNSYEDRILMGQYLLNKYALNKFDVYVDKKLPLNVNTAVYLMKSIKEDIFNHIGINTKDIPKAFDVYEFLTNNNWLENISDIPLSERIAANDPSLVSINL